MSEDKPRSIAMEIMAPDVAGKPVALTEAPPAYPALSVVSRRALSMDRMRKEGEYADRAQLLGLTFSSAHVVCTIGDIGDPTFRLWLSGHVAARLVPGARFTLEIV